MTLQQKRSHLRAQLFRRRLNGGEGGGEWDARVAMSYPQDNVIEKEKGALGEGTSSDSIHDQEKWWRRREAHR
ncbi:hypothetical protein LTR28_002660, partial [Elasticomyces elasticus]